MSGSSGRNRPAPPRPRRFPEVGKRAAAANAIDLDPLMTVCPTCATRFRVTESQLQAARGRVRCGACGSVFDGVDELILDMPREFASSVDAERALDELLAELMDDNRVDNHVLAAPELDREPSGEATGYGSALTAASTQPGADGGLAPPGPSAVLVIPEEAEPLAVEFAAAAEPAVPPLPGPEAEAIAAAVVPPGAERLRERSVEVEPVDDAEVPPVHAGVAAPSIDPVVFGAPRRRGRLWFLAFLLLGLLAVAGQTVWFRFDVLARDPAWRPVCVEICRWVGCKLPVQRDIRRIRTRNLTVGSAGEGSGILQIRVTIVNEAEFAQPFPSLELRFSTMNGILMAGYRFLPKEYLDGDAQGLELMPVGTPVQIERTIPDPGPEAVNYQLNLQ